MMIEGWDINTASLGTRSPADAQGCVLVQHAARDLAALTFDFEEIGANWTVASLAVLRRRAAPELVCKDFPWVCGGNVEFIQDGAMISGRAFIYDSQRSRPTGIACITPFFVFDVVRRRLALIKAAVGEVLCDAALGALTLRDNKSGTEAQLHLKDLDWGDLAEAGGSNRVISRFSP